MSSESRGDRLGDAAGDQFAQHRVQPAHHLGAGAAQVPVALAASKTATAASVRAAHAVLRILVRLLCSAFLRS
jgi:hypothetical protein